MTVLIAVWQSELRGGLTSCHLPVESWPIATRFCLEIEWRVAVVVVHLLHIILYVGIFHVTGGRARSLIAPSARWSRTWARISATDRPALRARAFSSASSPGLLSMTVRLSPPSDLFTLNTKGTVSLHLKGEGNMENN